MARAMQGWATGAIAAMAVAAIIGGVLIAGGPKQGRAERRDEMRSADLFALEQQLTCLAREKGRLETVVEATVACPAEPRLADPQTAEPYLIERLDEDSIRICAKLEVPRTDGQRGTVVDWSGSLDANGCRVVDMPKSDNQDGG